MTHFQTCCCWRGRAGFGAANEKTLRPNFGNPGGPIMISPTRLQCCSQNTRKSTVSSFQFGKRSAARRRGALIIHGLIDDVTVSRIHATAIWNVIINAKRD